MSKRVGRKVLNILLILAIAVTMTVGGAGSSLVFAEEGFTRTDAVEDIVKNMTLRQKINQCLMMDFRNWTNASGETKGMTELQDDVADIIADYQFGSIILFAPNIQETKATVTLTKNMQEAVMSKGGLPMIIATDQEGGIVYRLGSGTALPGNMALAATDDPANARIAGEIIGRELDAVGINTTLAPVIDVNNNANNPVIGLRAFSDDADVVGEYGSQYISGVSEYNIIGCAKHFPGHGDVDSDSHMGLPMVDKSLDELRANELKPYYIAIDKGIDMIMTAHILYPQIDDSTIMSKTGKEEARPATLSHKFLTEILRDDMGFRGVVITDAMNMQGVVEFFSEAQLPLEAIKAGADIVCMPVTGVTTKEELLPRLDAVIEKIEKAVESGDLPESRLDEAVTRILTLKENKGILAYNPDNYTVERAEAAVGSQENRELEAQIAAKAVTLFRNKGGVLPLHPTKDSKVLMLCPYNNERAQMVMGLNRAKQAGLVPMETEVKVYRYSAEDFAVEGALKENLDWADTVIITAEVSGTAALSLDKWTSQGPMAFTKYCKENGKTSVVMSADKPYDVQLYKDADAVIAVYGAKGSSVDVTEQLLDGDVTTDEMAYGPNIIAGVEVAFGNFPAAGKLPVNIPVFDAGKGEFSRTEFAFERGYNKKIHGASLSKSEVTYTSKAISPDVKVTDWYGDPLTKGTDYTVTVSGNKAVGKATVMIAGTGTCAGSITKSFRILPKQAVLKSVKAGKKSITVKTKVKVASTGGKNYQIAYKVKGAKKWKTKTTAKASLKIKKLKKGKKYVVKVRAFSKVSGKTYYGKWSKSKTSGKVK